jgi:hypothetical protein
MQAPTVHSFEQDHVPAGIHDRTGDRDPGLLAMSTAVVMIFFAPRCVRRLLSATYIPSVPINKDTRIVR